MIYKRTSLTPLFDLILNRDWPNVYKRLQTNPEEAQVWTSVCLNGKHFSRVLPLHIASLNNSNPVVIQKLIHCYPKAAKTKDSAYGRLPLHYACLRMPSPDLIKTLVAAYPEATRKNAAYGRLPLHYACSSGASKEVILVLLSMYVKAARHPDDCGWLPIHIGCLYNALPEVTEVLLNAYPESVFMKTAKKNTPVLCTQLGDKSPDKTAGNIMLLETRRLQLRKVQKSNSKKLQKERVQFRKIRHNVPKQMFIARIANAEFC